MRFRVKTVAFIMAVAFPAFVGTASAMTLQEARQKILDDYAYFDAQSALRRQHSAQALVDSKNLSSDPIVITQDAPALLDATLTQELEQIYLSLTQNQQATPTGLVASHLDDTSFVYHEGIQEEWAKIYSNTQAYTYDQALAGIAFLKHGDLAAAKKIFDFFYLKQQVDNGNFSGFWTVYNVDSAFDWKKYEWKKSMGENAWIALFSLQYSAAQQDATEKQKALELGTTVAKWIAGLPHHQGGVAMGAYDPTGISILGSTYSVENNLDIYSLFKTLMTEAASSDDRQLFTTEFNGLKNWLETQAFDSSAGLFKRGGNYYSGTNTFVWDGIQSLDVQSWALSAIGPATLINDFGISMDNFISSIHQTFAVQNNGTFGGDIFQAKGFDFSDTWNAQAIGRTGFKWIEGTNHMILAYEMLADFYTGDAVKSAYYQSLADHFRSRNAENAVMTAGALSYLCTDQLPLQVFMGSFWATAPGRAVASETWVYFSDLKLNPFEALQGLKPLQPFSSSASVSAFFPELDNLFIDVRENDSATVRYENRVFDGFFDSGSRTLHLDNVQNSPFAISESWDFIFDMRTSTSGLIYSLTSFETNLLYSDNWLYHHTYDFSPEGFLLSDYSLQMSDTHSVSQFTEYTYATSFQKMYVESTFSTTLFDNVYGYGTETHYFHGLDAALNPFTRTTITQETRNIPLSRVLLSYQLTIFDNGSVNYTDLGRQVLPL